MDGLTKLLGLITFKKFIKSLRLTIVAMAIAKLSNNAYQELMKVLVYYLYTSVNSSDVLGLARIYFLYLASVDNSHLSSINYINIHILLVSTYIIVSGS